MEKSNRPLGRGGLPKLLHVHTTERETAIETIDFGLHAPTLENVYGMFLDKESRLLKKRNGMLMILIILVCTEMTI